MMIHFVIIFLLFDSRGDNWWSLILIHRFFCWTFKYLFFCIFLVIDAFPRLFIRYLWYFLRSLAINITLWDGLLSFILSKSILEVDDVTGTRDVLWWWIILIFCINCRTLNINCLLVNRLCVTPLDALIYLSLDPNFVRSPLPIRILAKLLTISVAVDRVLSIRALEVGQPISIRSCTLRLFVYLL